MLRRLWSECLHCPSTVSRLNKQLRNPLATAVAYEMQSVQQLCLFAHKAVSTHSTLHKSYFQQHTPSCAHWTRTCTAVRLEGPHSAPDGATWVQTVAAVLPGVEFGTSGTAYDPTEDSEKPQC